MAVKRPKYGPEGDQPLDFQGKSEAEILIQLSKIDGFFQVYWYNMRYYRFQKELFNALNDYYQSKFDQPRYKNYDSFRKSLSHYLKK